MRHYCTVKVYLLLNQEVVVVISDPSKQALGANIAFNLIWFETQH